MAGTLDIQRLVLSQWPDAGLSKTERALLGYLAHADQPVSEAELLTQVWGYAPGVRSQTVQATVRRVRTKIEADPKRPVHLLTVRGHGYRLIVAAGERPAESTPEDAAHRLKRWLSAAGDEVTLVVRRDPRTNIGAPLDETIGREASFGALIDLFAQPVRVVTLHGSGGVGKTRLGRAVGRCLADDHIGGSWFCDVSEVSNGTGVVECVADALGIVRQVRRPVADQIADTVASKGPTFVVVDNAEQLQPDGVDALLDLLRRCAALRLLITSRRVLGLPGERVVPLGRLSPDDAAALLRQRVDAVRADRTDPIDEEAVHRLAERLDGIPLAIELAAARARVIPLRELAARMAQNFDVLDGVRSLGPERHRTLRQTFLWSWNLLAETQQLALVRLAVFRGGFTLDAASAVLEGLGEPLSLVAALADSALVHRHNDVPGRMALFDTLRAFALESGKAQVQDARERHAVWLLGTLSTEGLGAVRDADFRALHSEADNAAAVVAWLTQTRNPAVFRLLHRFYSVVYVTGQRIDVFQSWISMVRAAFDLDPVHAALLLFLESQLAIVEGSYARAAERSALALQKSPANAPVAAAILCTRALATTKLGRIEEGLEIANQAVAHPHRCGGRAFSVLGNALLANGRRDDALNAFRAAEVGYAGEGSSIGVA
ncbi:MAG: winged helix-turn-helix domain-containing protein, partial [Myxococcota bacterium]